MFSCFNFHIFFIAKWGIFHNWIWFQYVLRCLLPWGGQRFVMIHLRSFIHAVIGFFVHATTGLQNDKSPTLLCRGWTGLFAEATAICQAIVFLHDSLWLMNAILVTHPQTVGHNFMLHQVLQQKKMPHNDMRIAVTGAIYITSNISSYNSILVAFLWFKVLKEFSIYFNLMSLSLQKRRSQKRHWFENKITKTLIKTMNFLRDMASVMKCIHCSGLRLIHHMKAE